MTPGGAAGVIVIDQVDPGDAYQTTNTQKYGFQFGVDAAPGTGPFTVTARIQAPFSAVSMKPNQSMGVFIGTGDQDNYVKVVTTAAVAGGGVEALTEINQVAKFTRTPLKMPGPAYVDLVLRADPAAGTVQPGYSVGGAVTPVGGPVQVPGSWFTDCGRGLAVGLISTSNKAAPFPATYDFVRVTPDTPPPAGPPAVRCAQPQQQGAAGGQGDTTAPVISRVSLRPTRFAARSRGTTLLTRGSGGTRVRFRLSEAAKVGFTVARARAGRRSGRSCAKPSRKNRRGKRCTRYVAVRGSVSKWFRAGASTVRFTGRMRNRRLPVGSYRLRMRATDAAGNRSRLTYRAFRIRARG